MDTSHTLPKVLCLMSKFLKLGHLIDTLPVDHVGLPHVPDLADHLVNFFTIGTFWLCQPEPKILRLVY